MILTNQKILLDKLKANVLNKYSDDLCVPSISAKIKKINLPIGTSVSNDDVFFYGIEGKGCGQFVQTTYELSSNFDVNNAGIYSITYTLTGSSVVIDRITLPVEVKNMVYSFDFTGSEQIFNVPSTGSYKIEVWGAGGYNSTSSSVHERGGYAVGVVNLSIYENLYLYVGGKGDPDIGGYNGGGNAKTTGVNDSGAGGGATDVRLVSNDLYSRIIVAGGGGGGRSSSHAQSNAGMETGYAATQTNTGNGSRPGGFGFGGANPDDFASDDNAGGGGGWYGGSSGQDNYGGGGSNYVVTSLSYKPAGYNINSNYYMTGAFTISGNESMPSPIGSGFISGNKDHGYIKITSNTIIYE